MAEGEGFVRSGIPPRQNSDRCAWHRSRHVISAIPHLQAWKRGRFFGFKNNITAQSEQKGCRLCPYKCEDEGVYLNVNDRSPRHADKGARCALILALAEGEGFVRSGIPPRQNSNRCARRRSRHIISAIPHLQAWKRGRFLRPRSGGR